MDDLMRKITKNFILYFCIAEHLSTERVAQILGRGNASFSCLW